MKKKGVWLVEYYNEPRYDGAIRGWKDSINKPLREGKSNPYDTLEDALEMLAHEQIWRNVPYELKLDYRIRNIETGEIIDGAVFG